MAVQLPDFTAVGIAEPSATNVIPTFPSEDPTAAAQARTGAALGTLGTGLERAGTAAGLLGGQLNHQANIADAALAQSDLHTKLARAEAAIKAESDPDKINQLYSQLPGLAQDASQVIQDPGYRNLWMARHGQDVTKAQLIAEEQQRVVYNGRYLAGINQQAQDKGQLYAQSEDPATREQAANDLATVYSSLVDAGVMNPAQAQAHAEKAKQAMILGRTENLYLQNRPQEALNNLLAHANELDASSLVHAAGLAHTLRGAANIQIGDAALTRASGGIVGTPVQDEGGPGSLSERNIARNNPGNMKAPGGGWLSFPTPEAGVAAIGDWLQRHNAAGQTTIRQLIDDPQHGYAPSADPGNVGKGLPEAAAKIVGVGPDQPVDMSDPATRDKMVQAILTQEGNVSFLDKIKSGAAARIAAAAALPSVPTHVLPTYNQDTGTFTEPPQITSEGLGLPGEPGPQGEMSLLASTLEPDTTLVPGGALARATTPTPAPTPVPPATPAATIVPPAPAVVAPPRPAPDSPEARYATTLDRLNADPTLLDNPAAKARAIQGAELAYRADELRIAAALRAKKQASDASSDVYVKRMIDGDTANIIQDIAKDPTLDRVDREHLWGVASSQLNAPTLKEVSEGNSLELFRRIHLPDGDPMKITDTKEIDQARIAGQIDWTDLDKLRKEVTDMRTPEGERLVTRKKDFLDAFQHQIDKSNPLLGQIDQSGKEQFYKFKEDLEDKMDEYRREKKDPFVLLRPGTPDYFGKPENIDRYKVPIATSIANVPRSLGMPTGTLAPTPVPSPVVRPPLSQIIPGLPPRPGTSATAPIPPLVTPTPPTTPPTVPIR